MGQPDDALLDLIVKIRRAASSLSSASEDSEISAAGQDRMMAKAEGLSLAVALCEMQLRESRGEPRRVY